MSQLEGAVILVVGSTGVLGGLIASGLRDAGATVVESGRSGVGEGTLAADLSVPGTEGPLVEAALARHQRLDGLVIAAGLVAFGPASDLSDDTLEQLFEINTLAPIRLIRQCLPHLQASAAAGGSPFIATLSGIIAESPTAGMAAYSASKAGLAAFVKASSREVRKSGIRMLDARPGHTETGLATRSIEGTAPAFPPGLDPSQVSARIIQALVDDERDLPSSAF